MTVAERVAISDLHPAVARLLETREGSSEVHVPAITVPHGRWSDQELDRAAGGAFALVVVEGVLVRDIVVAGMTARELLGPGDLLAHRRTGEALLEIKGRWLASTPTRLAVLDERLLPSLKAEPQLAARIIAQAARQTARLTAQRAISQLPRVEDRLLAVFWLLAERWGRIGPAGVIVPLALTHESIGHLIGAARPTVSLALKELAADGALARRADGAWIVRHGSLAELNSRPTPANETPGEAGGVPSLVESSIRESEDLHPSAVSPRPAGAVISAIDVQQLFQRVNEIGDEFPARRATVAEVLERTRATRDAIITSRQRRLRPRRPGAPSAGSPH